MMKFYIDDGRFLSHHGVAGQKWGIRNAEWYPIANWEAHLRRVGNTVKSAASSAGKTIAKASSATGKGISKATSVTGRALAKTGKSVVKASKAVKRYHDQKRQEKVNKKEARRKEIHDRAVRENDVKFMREHKRDFTKDELNKALHDLAIKENDVKYMREHKRDFTNEELNRVSDRHLLENRFDTNSKDVASTKDIQDAIQKGDIKYAFSNKDKMTEDEINMVIARYNTNTKLEQLINANAPKKLSNQEKLDKALKGAENLTNVLKKGTDLWNAAVPIANAFTGSNLKKIGEPTKRTLTDITEKKYKDKSYYKETKTTDPYGNVSKIIEEFESGKPSGKGNGNSNNNNDNNNSYNFSEDDFREWIRDELNRSR